jgi:ribulose 1,5-bisphosphate synthetase/thiazole synthase
MAKGSALFAALVITYIIYKQTKKTEETVYDVVVVGAGVSGLEAANKLKALGYKVMILEA